MFRGELFVDPWRRSLYACDGSLYQIDPLAVACPQDADDVATLVQYASEHRLPLIPRGSGTTVSGGSLGAGIVVDCSRHLTRVAEITEDTVRAEAGTTLSQLNRQLGAIGRYIAPDPANASTTTVGGMLGVDAAGSRAASIGSMYDAVVSLELVTADGTHWEAAAGLPPTFPKGASGGSHVVQMLAALQDVLDQQAASIAASVRPGLVRAGGGYRLHGVRRPSGLDLPRLLVGSEGTLGLFTAATLRTLPLPRERGALVAVFDSLESAVRAVPALMAEQPTACDLLDRRLLNLARDVSAELSALLPASSAAALIVEWTALSHRELLHGLERYRRRLQELGSGCEIRRESVVDEEVDRLWDLPRQVVPLLQRISGRERPLPVVEDIIVPPEQLEEFVHRSQRILQQSGITASLYAHAPVGQVHMRPFLPPPSPHDGGQLRLLAEELYGAAWDLGGAIASEHGAGLSRSGWMRRQAGPLYPAFQAIKAIFDPQNLLNPGKIVTDDADLMLRHFRPMEPASPAVLDLQLRWSPEQMQNTAAACNGCGSCRTTQPQLRMCPVFRCLTDEAASPRGPANLVRHCLTGLLPAHTLGSPELKRLADLCFNCKQCHRECPSSVDVPHLAIEAKAQHVAQFGLPRSQWWLNRLLDAAGSWNRLAPLVNPLLTHATFRWWLERIAGLARQRRLPPFARRTFLRQLRPPYTVRPATVDERTAVYFVDYFANHHDPELGWACVRVLEKQGLKVFVPPRQKRCGMELVSAGDLEAARSLAEHNVRLLADLAREGATIVCSEPTAAVCLQQEYPLLLGTEDARIVAERTREAGALLAGFEARGEFATDFTSVPLTVGYHEPCHLRALGQPRTLRDLCGLIPDFRAPRIEAGCSGMAGGFGLEAANYERAQQIGEGLMRAMDADVWTMGLTECSSCRLQMEQPGQKPTLHPLKVLAMAYGLLPELRRRLLPLE